MKKTFDITSISSKETLNALSFALNDIEQVSHLKIGKDSITFDCQDIDVLHDTITSIDKNLVVREAVNGIKRNYDFGAERDRKYYFMFNNVVSEDDIVTFSERIKESDDFKEVLYDANNKVLILTTAMKDVLTYLQNELKIINPTIGIYEYHRPIRSNDVFNQKYLRNYFKIGLILVFIALAIVSGNDYALLKNLCWIGAIMVMSEDIVRSAIKNILSFHFLHEDVLILVGAGLGCVANHPIESIIAMILYMLLDPMRARLLTSSFKRINKVIEKPEVGIRELHHKQETIPLSQFEEGDIMVVKPDQVIPLYGYIIEGRTVLDTYPNTSSYDLATVGVGNEVHSGDINVGHTIRIRVRSKYKDTNFAHMMDVVSRAPIYTSRVESYIQKFSQIYTPVVVVIGVIVGIILPVIDYGTYNQFIAVGAILFMLSGSFASEQSASIGMLAGYAKAFEEGIYVESALGLDAINGVPVIIYDTIDNSDVRDDELDLFKKLAHMGRTFIVFNDSNKPLESQKDYKVYNYISEAEKLSIIDSFGGHVAYIGDSSKDIECFQKSYVAISRGGISHSKIVENSDIILMDNDIEKVHQLFQISRSVRTKSIMNLMFSLIMKAAMIIVAFTLLPIPLWLCVVYEAFIILVAMNNALSILK